MKLIIPKRTEDLRIKHFKVLLNTDYEGDITIVEVCKFMAEFTGEHLNDVLSWDANDMLKAYQHIKELYADIRINKPPQTIMIGGMEYDLINPHKVGSGWHIDFSKGDIHKDPVWMACLFYYPKGVVYGQTDENKNLLYPIAERYKLVERDMPLQTFLEASGFFLTKIAQSMRNSTEAQKTTEKIVKMLKPLRLLRGKKQ
tara:strand:- start:28353 stop:28952 length:600 start_codon:yes stop_codon:yes gene_type:complete